MCDGSEADPIDAVKQQLGEQRPRIELQPCGLRNTSSTQYSAAQRRYSGSSNRFVRVD